MSSQRVQLRRERGTLPETGHESALLSQSLLHWPIYAASHMHTGQTSSVFSSILPGSVLNPILGGSPVISSIYSDVTQRHVVSPDLNIWSEKDRESLVKAATTRKRSFFKPKKTAAVIPACVISDLVPTNSLNPSIIVDIATAQPSVLKSKKDQRDNLKKSDCSNCVLKSIPILIIQTPGQLARGVASG